MTDNPFVTNGYAGPQYFCDRVEENFLRVQLGIVSLLNIRQESQQRGGFILRCRKIYLNLQARSIE